MSSPTFGPDQPGPDPSYPQGSPPPPQGQPGWGAAPPPPAGQGYGAPQQGYGAPAGYGSPAGYGAASGQRPPQVTTAAVIGIVIGALGSLGGLLGLFGVGLVFAFDAILGLLTIASLVVAVVVLVGGIQALQGKSPRLLLMGSYASIGVQLLYLLWSIISGWGFAFLGLLGFLLPAIIVFLLMQPQAKQFYASRGISY
jgi:hypothetical protein